MLMHVAPALVSSVVVSAMAFFSDVSPPLASHMPLLQPPALVQTVHPEKKKSKTIYLIRHAESLENVAYAGARRAQARYAARKLPDPKDIVDMFKLTYKMFRPTVMNAELSPLGRAQVANLYDNLKRDQFLVNDNDRDFLIVHSPLMRAKQTAYGSLFGPEYEDECEPPPNTKHTIMELHSLREVNPVEIIYDTIMSPIKKEKTVDKRIAEFEHWLESRDEDIIVVVGHSVYFKRMLNLPKTFDNCDIWQAHYGGEGDDPASLLPTKATRNIASKGVALVFKKSNPPMAAIIESDQTEFDLPRSWKSLRRLYHYAPEPIPVEEDEPHEGSMMN
uniref:Uncharacterized protein n=1 Tax=Pseudictyota dubia TaxID=2749911 RepID=A0A7R9W3H5_9STRA|mmetsp:Transcript_31645/g.58329  ORF Transcript_31645/g.58329 Transcript_31645/m.58329 type:complete len:333 (+) Transcript_31645:109-1107(+)|eukprot:CAMPEP_0197456440 /NCGR_PEP_ID=MMETSP1175-20131217/43382_1 /TAXON_ID=1003142 /ORGANISM="Triceratium dubium, Strain CCMP147" /LENGTH=332 /DNA_ID=CAMNT_0042990521 /DNA_START=90 /DNA_END=1088 /DNA_ORIENTATION=-